MKRISLIASAAVAAVYDRRSRSGAPLQGRLQSQLQNRSRDVRYFSLMLAMCAVLAFTAIFLFAYTHEQDDVSGPVPTKWCNGNLNSGAACTNQVTWNLNPGATNVNTTGGPSLLQTIQNAFASWQQASLSGQSAVSLGIVQGATDATQTAPNSADCVNVIGFVDPTPGDFSTGTLAFTEIATAFGAPPTQYVCNGSTYTCPLPSCITDADIEFNPNENFSTASPTPTNDYDLQAIATHEIGHLLGLDHSGLASSIMFAFGDSGGVPQRTLSVDDTLGIGSMYPSSNFGSITGALSGTITLGGSGIFAAHVVVTDSSSGIAVADGLTNTDGTYQIDAPPGTYNVVALPLAGIYGLSSFGGWACGYSENSPPCCDPALNAQLCNGTALNPPANYSGQFH